MVNLRFILCPLSDEQLKHWELGLTCQGNYALMRPSSGRNPIGCAYAKCQIQDLEMMRDLA